MEGFKVAIEIPVLKYPGSKWNISDWIISSMPPHKAYLEPFFGGGAVFFSKEPVGYETINDINSDVTNLFKVIRERPDELSWLVDVTPYSRKEFLEAHHNRPENELERARVFLVKCWQGFGSRLSSRPGWSCEIKPGAKQNSIVGRWNKVPEAIQLVTGRLKNAQIENMDAVTLIKRYRREDILIYADPPYVMESRTGGKYYSHEMTNEQHIRLLEVLNQHPGPVLISGYESDLYQEHLEEWTIKKIQATTEKGQVRTEILWINKTALERIESAADQGKLFEEGLG
jgi:DNA adenine methylase